MSDIDTLAATIRQQLAGAEQYCEELIGFMSGFGPSTDLPTSPVRVLAVVRRDRRLLDLLLAEKHRLWESCAAKDHSDNPLYRDRPCTCGRDDRVAAYLAVLAEGYEETT